METCHFSQTHRGLNSNLQKWSKVMQSFCWNTYCQMFEGKENVYIQTLQGKKNI